MDTEKKSLADIQLGDYVRVSAPGEHKDTIHPEQNWLHERISGLTEAIVTEGEQLKLQLPDGGETVEDSRLCDLRDSFHSLSLKVSTLLTLRSVERTLGEAKSRAELGQVIADLQAQVEEHKTNAESWRNAYVQQAWHMNLMGCDDYDDDDEDGDDDE